MNTNKAARIVNKMLENDHFSKWLDIQASEIGEGQCRLSLTVKKEMLNGFGIAHGGITYSLADSALAFASNSHGQKSVSISTSIEHLQPVRENDKLIAEAKEIHRSRKTGHYEVRITNQNDHLVAIFRGTVYRKTEEWF